MSTIIVSAVGSDRPGMVAGLSAIIAEQNCNLEDCAMTRLGGQFSMILTVNLPPQTTLAQLEPLFKDLSASHGLNVHCDEISGSDAERSVPNHMLTVYAKDRPGLLANTSHILAENDVNITDVQTRLASNGGLYVMLFEIEIPETLDAADLEKKLRTAAQELDMTLTLRPLDGDVL